MTYPTTRAALARTPAARRKRREKRAADLFAALTPYWRTRSCPKCGRRSA